jgi:hypothetical protein
MAVYNPTIKRYARDFGVMVPNVEFCPTEYPRLHAHVAPYLPLQLFVEKHNEYYVVLQGKVVALDSMGFLVPAGYAIEQETAEGLANWGSGNVNFTSANASADFIRYSQADVDNGVKNSRGIAVTLNEPVIYSMIRMDGNPLQAYSDSDVTVDCDGAMTFAVTIGDHIGCASGSWLRTSMDTISRASNAHLFNTGSATGMEARKAEDDGTLERNEHWRLQMEPKTVRTNYCLILPVVDSYDPLIEGQMVAVADDITDFVRGSRVTFDRDSNIVVAEPEAVTVGGALQADIQDAVDAALASLKKYHNRIVGQVIKIDTRHPKSLLDKVKTRWDASIPGFEALDRMPGSATDGYPDNMHKAQSTMGEVVISLFMR